MGPLDAAGFTARWEAASRARESERPDALFGDPYARELAGAEGFERLDLLNNLSEPPSHSPRENPYLPVRTRFFDEFLQYAARSCPQIVILGAGMDARAFRLPWHPKSRIFEIDRAPIFAAKEPILKRLGARSRCERYLVAADITEDFRAPLLDAGFRPDLPTAWLAEGLVVYLAAADVDRLMVNVSAMSASHSRIGVDLADTSLFHWPPLVPYLERLAFDGSPWLFGTPEPELMLEYYGWRACAAVVGEPAASFGRWPYPPVPRAILGLPRTYLVTSLKR